jgi:hypothetical protein
MSNIIAMFLLDGTPKTAKTIDDGKCVATIVMIGPRRLEIDEATIDDAAEIKFVINNRVPSAPSFTLNRSAK